MLETYCGWIDDPEAVRLVLSSKVNPLFSDAAPHLDNYYQGEDIGLWRAAIKVTGKVLPADKQTIGDCVSHGHSRGLDYLWCAKQAAGLMGGYQEGKTSAMSEFVYGESRKFGNILGPSDGSVGAFAVGGLKAGGYIFRNDKPYDGQLAKQLGSRGPSSEMEAEAQKLGHFLDYAQVSNTKDAANGLKAGCPVTICSGQGFSMTRDANGICRPQGSWAHCMCVIGCFMLSGQLYFVILQSWGQNTPSGPVPCGDAPDNSFGCDEQTMNHILGQKTVTH